MILKSTNFKQTKYNFQVIKHTKLSLIFQYVCTIDYTNSINKYFVYRVSQTSHPFLTIENSNLKELSNALCHMLLG